MTLVFCEDPPQGECSGQQDGNLGNAGGPLSVLVPVVLVSSDVMLVVLLLVVTEGDSDTVEAKDPDSPETASEAGSEVDVLLEIVLIDGDSVLPEVDGTTVGSSSSTVRSTTSVALCLSGCMTVETRLRLLCSWVLPVCEFELWPQ